MRTRRSDYLATTALAVASLVAAAMPAHAQAVSGGDPPARVGQLAFMQGTVSFHTAGEDHWEPATLNYPVTNGNAFWTEPQALAEIAVTASSLWMNASTEFDITTLDSRSLQAVEPQGELYVHLRYLAPGETYTIQTPRGTVTLAANGRYDIVAGDTATPTTVSVLDGAAQIAGNNISLQVQANQTASITGTDTFQGSVGPLSQDAFLAAMIQREQPAAQAASLPPAVQQMTGCEELQQYGTWQSTPDYGEVWYPQVDADWVPYREGSWSYVAPWGWTWVDADAWGFAPFHYGRWVQVGGRWGWVPVSPGVTVTATPVYAPALVTFFGLGAAAAIGAGYGSGAGPAFSHGNIGWVPLGPGEPYRPPYRVSGRYLRDVNAINVRDPANITRAANDITINRFANHAAATVVPAAAIAASRPVAREVQHVDPGRFSQVRPVFSRAPIAPTAQTNGVTPAVARALRLPASAGTARPAAPGPAVNESVFRHAAGRLPSAPALRPAGATNPAGPAPRADELRPGGAAPGIRPGAEVHPGAAPPGAPGPEIRSSEPGRGGLPPLLSPHREVARPGTPAAQAQPGRPGAALRPEAASRSPALVAPNRPEARPGAVPEPRREATPGTPSAALPSVHGPAPTARTQPEMRSAAPPHPAPAIERAPAPHMPAPVPHSATPFRRPAAPAPHAAPAPRPAAPPPRAAEPRPAPHAAAPHPGPAHAGPSHPGPGGQREERRP